MMITRSDPGRTSSGIRIFFTLSLAMSLFLLMSFRIEGIDAKDQYGNGKNGVIEISGGEKIKIAFQDKPATREIENNETATEIQDAVIATAGMKVLYRGIANPVEVAVPGIASDKVVVTVTNGTINRIANGWEVMPGNGNETVMTVLVNNKRISEKTFRVKDIPTPVAVLHGKNSGSFPRGAVSKIDSLKVEINDFDLDVKFEITSFSLLLNTGSAEIEVSTTGNKLTDEMKSMISGLMRGQNLIFKDIRAAGPDGNVYNLSPIIVKID